MPAAIAPRCLRMSPASSTRSMQAQPLAGGLHLELMRIAVEDFEAEHGLLTAEEIEEARRDLASAIDRSATG